MDSTAAIFVAGHSGMVGGAIMRALEAEGYCNIVTRRHRDLDLTDMAAVEAFFAAEKIAYVFLAAARVGGIGANQDVCGAFIRDNLLIQTHVIDAARRHGVVRLLFLGSSCIYPKLAPQPMREECLLTGPLEPTNSAYAIAKIAGLEMCEAYRRQYGFDAVTVMPSNVYGIGDNFSPGSSHVAAALMRRIHEANSAGDARIIAWGSGKPLREFIYADDLGRACLHLMRGHKGGGWINAGSGEEISIAGLAAMLAEIIGYRGLIAWDRSKADGTPRKIMDSSRLRALGWQPSTSLRTGLENMYAWFLAGQQRE